MKFAIAAAIAIVVAIGGYAGYTRYEQQKFQESITTHVKNASLRLANAVRYETEKDTKISYKELFEKLESDISEIDKRIIDVQTLATTDSKEVTDPVLAYLKDSQELLRALLQKYRKQLSASSADDQLERELYKFKNARGYGREYAIEAAQKASKDYKEAVKEYIDATADVLSAARKMTDVQAKIAPFIRSDALTDIAIFEAIVQKNVTDIAIFEAIVQKNEKKPKDAEKSGAK